MLPTEAAMPGECHPAYAEHVESIRRWFTWTDAQIVRVPFFREPAAVFRRFDADEPVGPAVGFGCHTLQRETAWGPAPYVGTPFAYTWLVYIDELGRQVASERTKRVAASSLRDGPFIWPEQPAGWNQPAC